MLSPDPPQFAHPADHYGGEPLEIDTIGNALVVKEGDAFLFTDESGEIRPEARAGFGLYHDDTRYLSEYRLTLMRQEPVFLLSTAETGYSSEQVMTNRRARPSDGAATAPETLHVRRTRTIEGGLAERLEVWNHGPEPLLVDIELRFAADFADLFEVRGIANPPRGVTNPPAVTADGVRYAYRSLDGRALSTEVRFSEPPASIDAGTARYQFELRSQAKHEIEIHFAINQQQPRSAVEAIERNHRSYSDWRRQPARVIVDHRLFQEALDRSFDDIRMLQRPYEGDTMLAAGVPWFDAPFGRDSIIASLQMLPYRPEIARGTLRLLARHQGRKVDPEREEQPGKILHELRGGELARTGHIPFGRYYGSIDSTPLFIALFAEYMAWTDDRPFIEEMMPHIDAALRWIDEHGDVDGDGYIEYARSTEYGLANQGWKDSGDSIIDERGATLSAPIALAEPQAYVYAAYRGLARVLNTIPMPERARELVARSERLRAAFRRDYYLPEHKFIALALDGEKRPSAAIASNAGHALWAGIVSAEEAKAVADRLLSPDIFSGWGIRTLSTTSPRYNPMGYHVGTVWPHDNSIAGMGFKRYGHDEHLERLILAQLDVARASPYYRLPELFCGHERADHSPPVPYPVACRPQAWAAGALPYYLQAMLGLVPDAANGRLFLVRPSMPAMLNSVLIEDLRVGGGSLHLLVERHYDRINVRAIGATGIDIEVVSEWPDLVPHFGPEPA